jgi:hypothetical protein
MLLLCLVCDKLLCSRKPVLWFVRDLQCLKHEPDMLTVVLTNPVIDALAAALGIAENDLVMLSCTDDAIACQYAHVYQS